MIVGTKLRRFAAVAFFLGSVLSQPLAQADNVATIERVKGSIVAVGTFVRTRTPQFQFLGTGFAVGDGTLIATNAHVVPKVLDPAQQEIIAILAPVPTKDSKEQAKGREAKRLTILPISRF